MDLDFGVTVECKSGYGLDLATEMKQRGGKRLARTTVGLVPPIWGPWPDSMGETGAIWAL